MLSITREFRFEAAHRLYRADLTDAANGDIFGRCSRFHGHTYRLRVSLSGETDENGWILDFSKLKAIVFREVIDHYDHTCLNDLPDYENQLPTAENMAKVIFSRLRPHLDQPRYQLRSVAVFETTDSWAEWTSDHDAGNL